METRILTCAAPIGTGGLGQHLAQLVAETRAAGLEYSVFCTGCGDGDGDSAGNCHVVEPGPWDRLLRPILQRLPGATLNTFDANQFDKRVAEQLDIRPNRLMGFVGTSLHSFRRARDLGAEVLELIAANSHVNQLTRQHQVASRQLGIDDTWLGRGQIEKTLREYEVADLIYVHSDYTRDSMLAEGIPATKLVRTHLRVAPRFVPKNENADVPVAGSFRIVYAGRLDATKGVPLLIRAFKELNIEDSKLRLVGGFASRAIREHCIALIAGDPRITVRSGDPLQPFQDADVYVHPSYEDGFAYAPAEALACGTPVIVTEDTGMKEYVRVGENGFVIPTGDVGSIVECLRTIRDRPLKSTRSLLPPAQSKPSASVTRR